MTLKTRKRDGTTGSPKGVCLTTVVVAAILLNACSNPSDPPGETATELRLAASPSVVAGQTLSLVIEAAGSRGSVPLTSFEGDVTLTASVGKITPNTVPVTRGRAAVDVTLSAATGTVTLAASGGGVSGSIDIDIDALGTLPGDPSAPLIGALPDLDFIPRDADYSEDPALGGVETSHRTLVVMFRPDATLGDVNVLLANHGARIAGAIPLRTMGVVTLQFDSSTHAELATTLAAFRASPLVRFAVQDVRLESNMVPDSHPEADPPDWVWIGPPFGGNWGLQASRVPQMWNLNEALLKRTNHRVVTGIFDLGFFEHEDLRYVRHFNSAFQHVHGTHVAGIIGAGFSNHKGIDGVTPFADLDVYARDVLAFSPMLDGIQELAVARARVINISMGIPWPVDPEDIPLAVALVSALGESFKAFLEDLEVPAGPPLIVNSAGNASRGLAPPIDAKYNNGPSWAGLALRSDDVIVVEAVELVSPAPLTTRRAEFSNGGGDVSAPGVGILSTIGARDYKSFDGTSMAAPHVAGLASYLLSIDPALSNRELKELIVQNAVPVTDLAGNPAPRLDAYASALDIDFIRGNTTVLRMLVDIDDGTRDGNLRVRPGDGTDFILEDADGDGGIGDGQIDMADFRRWRDWYHGLAETGDITLDGSPTHPKRDVNGNGIVELALLERAAPRGDFNGDGKLHPTDAIDVAGEFVSKGPQSDLDMLARLFSDPFVHALNLPDLVDSGDLHVDLAQLVESGRFSEVTSRVTGEGFVDARGHTETEPTRIYTLATGIEYTVEIWGLGATANNAAAADTLCQQSRTVLLKPCEDIYYAPECLVRDVVVQITLAQFMEPGTPSPLLIRAGIADESGIPAFQPGISIDLLVTGGSAATTRGSTDADGFFQTEVTLDVGTPQLNVFVTAKDPVSGGSTVARATASALSTPGGRVFVLDQQSQVQGGVSAGDEQCQDGTTLTLTDFEDVPLDFSFACDAFAQGETHSSSIDVEGMMQFDVDPQTQQLTGASLHVDAVAQRTRTGLASSGITVIQAFTFEVRDQPVEFSAVGHAQSGEDFMDRFQLFRDGDFSNPIYQVRGRIVTLTLDESGTLPPGRYVLITEFAVFDWFSGNMQFDFTLR